MIGYYRLFLIPYDAMLSLTISIHKSVSDKQCLKSQFGLESQTWGWGVHGKQVRGTWQMMSGKKVQMCLQYSTI